MTAVRNTPECSFSKLKLIETFHKSTTINERLTNLALVSIENETAKISNMTELITTFASVKTRKQSFS